MREAALARGNASSYHSVLVAVDVPPPPCGTLDGLDHRRSNPR